MASLHLAISALRLVGRTDITEATRRACRNMTRPAGNPGSEYGGRGVWESFDLRPAEDALGSQPGPLLPSTTGTDVGDPDPDPGELGNPDAGVEQGLDQDDIAGEAALGQFTCNWVSPS